MSFVLPRASVRTQTAAVFAAFALNGFSFGMWAVRIPAIKAQTGLDDAGLGFSLLAASLGAVLTMFVGGWLGSRLGSHVTTSASLAGCAAMLPFMGGAWNYATLTLSLLVFGMFQGTMDVSMNANGVAVEHAGARAIMSKLHGSWSIGQFVGAFVSAQVVAAGIPPFPQFTVEAVFLLGAAVVLRWALLPDRHVESGGLRRPSGPLILLGVIALIGLMAEGSAYDWGGIFMHGTVGTSEATAGYAVAAFGACMAVARLTGDRLYAILGAVRLVGGGALLSAAGLGLALSLAQPTAAILGFGLMGAGLGAVVPTTFRAAGAQPGIPASVGIAAVSTVGYAGGLLGPPIIGTVAQTTTLRMALGIDLVLLVVLAIGSRFALRSRPTS